MASLLITHVGGLEPLALTRIGGTAPGAFAHTRNGPAPATGFPTTAVAVALALYSLIPATCAKYVGSVVSTVTRTANAFCGIVPVATVGQAPRSVVRSKLSNRQVIVGAPSCCAC